MRFIELLFGLSPDNNSGITEAAILLAISAGVFAVWYLSIRLKRAKRGSELP
jgi:hypothetical protein